MTKPKPKSKDQPQPQPKSKEEERPDSEEEQLFADTNVTMKSGHLTKDPEIVGDGKYAKIRFAGNKQYKTPDGEIKTNTNYYNALISNNLADAFDLASSLKKGDWVYVKGEDSTRSFDTPEGYKQTASTIFAYHVVKKEKKPSSSQEQDNIPAELSTTNEAVPAEPAVP